MNFNPSLCYTSSKGGIHIKSIYLLAGCLSLFLGLIGVILPVLPTTPFLLLAGYCFARSSKSLEESLKKSKLYTYYAKDYATSRSIAKSKKKAIIIQIYILMGISIYFAPLLPVKIFLGLLTVFITYYLFWAIPDKKE